jgi:RimJ/RimL family protein N-acetyltransferase
MKKDQNIKYFQSPDEEKFPNTDVTELVRALLESEINMTSDGTRSAAASVLDNEDVQRVTKNMCEFRDEGNTIIAKDGEKTVGMIGYEKHPFTAPTGQRIFEIRRNTVLDDPNYRRKGIGRELQKRMIKRVQEIDPDALLVARIHTKNVASQNLSNSTRFKLITTEDMKQLGFAEKWIVNSERNGYEFYIIDPRKSSAQKKSDAE